MAEAETTESMVDVVELVSSLQPGAIAESYWRANMRLIGSLLGIWLTAAYLPVLIVQPLNQLAILTGFPLGYYMASQGSLIVFVVLIVYYAWRLAHLDNAFNAINRRRKAERS